MEHFHTGFYNKKDITKALRSIAAGDFEELREIKTDEECPYTDASNFLCGSCTLFALALHNRFDYVVYEIVRKGNSLAHAFCQADYGDKKIYIDVRGITSDFTEFMTGILLPPNEEYCIQKRDTEQDILCPEKYDDFGYAFAEAVINRNPEFYTLHK